MSSTIKFESLQISDELPMMPPKVCGCGAVHETVPKKHKVFEGHMWFDCQCGSTLLRTNYLDWLLDLCDEKNRQVKANIDQMMLSALGGK